MIGLFGAGEALYQLSVDVPTIKQDVPKRIVPEAIALCEEIMAGTDQKAKGDFMGRAALYAREKDEFFRRFDGGIANIAYSTDRIWKKQVTKP